MQRIHLPFLRIGHVFLTHIWKFKYNFKINLIYTWNEISKEQLNRFASRFHWRKIYERNKRVSISSRFHGVNLGCGTEQRRERIATESRQSWNPRRDRKIRIVGSSRLMKHSAHASRGRGPIPARSSVKIARSITNQPGEDEGRKAERERKRKQTLVTPKNKDVGYLSCRLPPFEYPTENWRE